MAESQRAVVSVFDRHVAHLHQLLDGLEREGVPLTADDQRSVLQELLVALEELQVVDEHLAEQNTQLEVASELLEAERHHYESLYEYAPEAYFVTDELGVIQEVNQAAARLLNIKREYLPGKPIAVYFVDDERLDFRTRLRELAHVGEPVLWEARMQPRGVASVEVTVSGTRYETRDAGTGARRLRWLVRHISESDLQEATERERLYRMTFDRAAVGMAHFGATRRWQRVNQKFCEILGYTADEIYGVSVRSVVHEDERAAQDDLHKRMIAGTLNAYSSERRYLRKDGSMVWVNESLSVVRASQGFYMYTIVVIEDITWRKAIEAAEREQRSLAEALRDAALALTSTLNLREVIDLILTNIERVVPHDAASMLLVSDGVVQVVQSRGYAEHGLLNLEDALAAIHVPIDRLDVLRTMADTRLPLLVSDRAGYDIWSSLPGMENIRSFIGVPIAMRDEIVGFLLLHSLTPDYFTTTHSEHLQAFAAQAVIAIHNARLHEHVRTLAVLEERQRLARDLHDAVSQTLFSANVLAESLPRLLTRSPERLTPNLEQLQVLTRSALAEMRTLLLELRPDHLVKIDLRTHLRQLVDAVKGRKRVAIEVNVKDTYPVPSQVQLAYYRIAQEALNNVVKHSTAKAVRISLVSTQATILLHISDNGKGFDSEAKSLGLGIDMMRERADAIGAELTITSAPGKGTTVQAVWLRTGEPA